MALSLPDARFRDKNEERSNSLSRKAAFVIRQYA